MDVENSHQMNMAHTPCTVLTSAASGEVLGVASECNRLCSEVCLTSTTAFVLSGSCAGLDVGATSCGVEATGASLGFFPTALGVLT